MQPIKTALITGGSSGLGYEFARLFAKDKYHLVLVARDSKKLEEVKSELEGKFGVNVKTITKDLSLPSSAKEIFDELKNDNFAVDILVNNAGFSRYGPFKETSIEEDLSEINVNIIALTTMTKLFLGEMLKKGSGKILNITSTASFAPGPMMSVYFSTKAYVLSFSESINEELQGTGVTVTTLCPGPTDTGFAKRALVQNSHLYKNPMRADIVARIGYDGLMQNKKVVIPGFKNKLYVLLLRLVPRSLAPRVVKRIW